MGGLYDFKGNPIAATGEAVFTVLMVFACFFPAAAVAGWQALAGWVVSLPGHLFR